MKAYLAQFNVISCDFFARFLKKNLLFLKKTLSFPERKLYFRRKEINKSKKKIVFFRRIFEKEFISFEKTLKEISKK